MQVDKTTLHDLAIFHRDEAQSLFQHLNYTTSIGGREWLHHLLAHPYSDLAKIEQTQATIQLIIEKEAQWPAIITNGTIMVVQKFFESGVEDLPKNPSSIGAYLYKVTHSADYSLLKFSTIQFIHFFAGLQQLLTHFDDEKTPPLLQAFIDQIKSLTARPIIKTMMQWPAGKPLSTADNLAFGYYILHQFKQQTLQLVDIFHKLDAYKSMAVATTKLRLSFPKISKTGYPFIEGKKLYHPLLHKAVAYDVTLNQEGNFLFLTGANMAGKSTFIKAVGVSVYLAHTGMGVPAENLSCSLFDGLLSNIQVEDNISKGESYFYNEVQRIKKTIEKINDGRNWLILIDELFKGTNVEDAMKCSTAVIEGLRKMTNTLFILSTHLYEIGEGLKQYSNIRFNYFETDTANGQLLFSYQLKEGISNDRLGYLILKREGVVDMLEGL